MGTQSVELLRALDLVDKLSHQVLELSGRLGFLQAELQQRDAVILALSAPSTEPQEEPKPSDHPMISIDPPEPRRWWQRILFG
jgi:hypothetical protein